MSGSSKIVTLEDLGQRVAQARAQGRRTVLCHGCFDLLHIGHIRHFRQARALGDLLVVTVTPDRFVNKGDGRPAFPETFRLEALAALADVDYVALNHWPQAVETLRMIRPDVYVKGSEYRDAQKDLTGGIAREREAIESVGGQLAFTDDVVFSSSSLINRFLNDSPPEVISFLDDFRRRFDAGKVMEVLRRASGLKVLVIGETIIDEYQYCEAIGKSSKEPTLAVKDLYTQTFAGGILAVANHVAAFCDRVELVSQIGDTDSREAFIRERLHPSVSPVFLTRSQSPTIVKKRLIEHYFFTKMLEVYTINDALPEPSDNDALCRRLEQQVPDADVVIVVDFGHSLMTREAIDIVASKARFLALNVQTNAGNMGYNMVSRYPRADFISLAEKEIRLESRDMRGNLEAMMAPAAARLKCPRMVVTCGRSGSLCYDAGAGFVTVPAFARRVVDRVGAGDASLAVSALCAALGAPMELVGFVGNVVGAWAVSTVCNEQAVDRTALFRQIETLLK